eukprot:Skav208412  [mRNA]  locus=scaffold2953:123344:124158:+ [translate_table: standard]
MATDAESFLPTVAATELEDELSPPTLQELLEGNEAPVELCRTLLKLMRRLLCRRSPVEEAQAAEETWLLPWVQQWRSQLTEEAQRWQGNGTADWQPPGVATTSNHGDVHPTMVDIQTFEDLSNLVMFGKLLVVSTDWGWIFVDMNLLGAAE